MRERQPEIESRTAIPAGYYKLGANDLLQASDLVWSWSSKEFLRADSIHWRRSPLRDRISDMVCCIRKASASEFAREVPKQRVYTVQSSMPLFD